MLFMTILICFLKCSMQITLKNGCIEGNIYSGKSLCMDDSVILYRFLKICN